jgi:hypothetical protein
MRHPCLWGAALAAATLALASAGARADGETFRATGIVCKTQVGLESVYAYAAANNEASAQDAISATNGIDAAAGCGIKRVLFKPEARVSNVHIKGDEGDIYKISILAECDSRLCVYAAPTAGYTALLAPPSI